MTAIIIIVVVTSLVAAYEVSIPAIVEASIRRAVMEEAAALAMAEEACRCKACLLRREKQMYRDMFECPEDFLREIRRANGGKSTALVWAKETLREAGIKY